MPRKRSKRGSSNWALFQSAWPRFDEYEIRNGYIRPTAAAKERGLIRGSGDVRAKRDDEVSRSKRWQPALGLIEFGDLLDANVRWNSERARPDSLGSFTSPLTDRDERQIVEWCNTHGLLGLLLHQVEAVFLYPRYQKSTDLPGFLVPTYRRYVRVGTLWYEGGDTDDEQAKRDGSPDVAEGDVVPTTDLKEGWLVSRVIVRSIEGSLNQRLRYSSPELQPLDRLWARYFADVSQSPVATKQHPYPVPGSEEFWGAYAEPVFDFLRVAQLLADCAKGLGKAGRRRGKDREDHAVNEAGARETLNLLAEPVQFKLAGSNGEYSQKLQSPSLLGDLAAMVIADAGQSRIVVCEGCGKIFATDAYQMKFCQETCANRIRKRRQSGKVA